MTIKREVYNEGNSTWECKVKYEYQYQYTAGAAIWTLKFGACTGDALRTETRSSVTGTDGQGHTQRTVTYTVQEGTADVWQRQDVLVNYGWGYVPTSYEAGTSTGSTLRSTRSYYYTQDPTKPGRYRKLKSWTSPDGSWSMFDYDADGRPTLVVSSYRDASMPSEISESVGHAIVNDYTPVSGQGDSGAIKPKKPRLVIEKINGVPVAKTFYVYYSDNGEIVQIEDRCIDPTGNGSYGATGNLRTIRRYLNEDSPERLASVIYPDGRMDKYTYTNGLYKANADHYLLGEFPSQQSGSSQAVQIVIEHGKKSTSDTLELVTDKSTKEVIIQDKAGNELQREVYAYIGSGYQLFEYSTQVFDSQGWRTDRYGSDNTHLSWVPTGCCAPASFTDATGVKTEYEYDTLGRLKKETKTSVTGSSDTDGSYEAQPAVETEYFYEVNAEGYYQVRKVVRATDGGTTLSLTSETVYDDAGRVIKQIGQDRLPTTYGYTYVTDPTSGQVTEHTVTKTLPCPSGTGNEITEITRYWRDGGLRSLTGTGVVHRYIDRGLDASNRRYTKTYTGPSLYDSMMWQQTTQDVFGRAYQESRSGYNNSTLTTNYSYNSAGQLVRVESPGKPDTLYGYDDLGDVKLVCQDIYVADPNNRTIDLASADRITGTETKYGSDGTYVWRKSISTVYGYSDDAQTTPSSTAIPVSQHWVARKLRGIASDDTIELAKSFDVDLNVVLITTTVDRDEADRLVKRKTIYADNGTDPDPYELVVSRNGALQLSKSTSGLTTTYAHDALGRQERVTDPRGNYTNTVYYEGDNEGDTPTFRNRGKVLYAQDAAGNRTTYAYNSDTGRVASITTADGQTEQGVQRFSYNKRGQTERTWGNTPYPVEYGYDDFGRQTSMKTYRGGSGWAGTDWPDPEDRGMADETKWVFDQYSGLLTEKQYADHNPSANPPVIRNIEYTYENDGRLKKRLWSRLNGANRQETEYLYGTTAGSAISDLTKIDYKGTEPATPDVEYTFNRLGRHNSIQDVVGTRTFAYDAAKLRLTSEAIVKGTTGLYTRTIARLYEGSGDILPGRYKGFRIGTSTPYEYETTYAYDDSGRLERITGPGLDGTYGAVYARLVENSVNTSDLVEYTYFKSSSDATLATIHRKYQGNRDLVEFVENLSGSTTVSKYIYTTDTLGRRTQVARKGTAFPTPPSYDGFADVHAYNSRNELDLTNRYYWTESGGPQSELDSSFEFDFTYDNIGNRTFYDVDRGDPPASISYTPNNVNQYTNQGLSYDEDGNMTADPQFEYFWDAENRLIRVATSRGLGQAGVYDANDMKVEYQYDYMSRRVERKVWICTAGGANPTWQAAGYGWERFVYDEWNVVMVLNGSDNTAVKKYTWGLDLSGTLHGAGGIGGLLASDENGSGSGCTGKFWFFYDANGNVGQIFKYVPSPESVTLAAYYEYDPYGGILNSGGSGAYPSQNPVRFSTKWFDVDFETGLGYWGYRYYSPRLGRWISRDPAGEAGGLNLLAFVLNSPMVYVDVVGYQAEALPPSPPAIVTPAPAPPPGGVPMPSPWPPPGAPGAPGAPGVPGTPTPVATPTPAATCTISRIGSYLMRCCSVGIGAVTVVLCSPTPCGTGNYCPGCGKDLGDEICQCPPPKPKGCKPCIPPVGTVGYIVDTTHSHNGWNPHTHHMKMNQSPPPVCKCFWSGRDADVTQGNSPRPGEVPFPGEAQGGGLEE